MITIMLILVYQLKHAPMIAGGGAAMVHAANTWFRPLIAYFFAANCSYIY